eukprot:jgi/Mesvir1/2376/Mv22131-RA.1
MPAPPALTFVHVIILWFAVTSSVDVVAGRGFASGWNFIRRPGHILRRKLVDRTPPPLGSGFNCSVTSCERGLNCTTGCDRGNCNYRDGTCQCQYGFTGSTCSEYMMPSCHLGPTNYPGWTPPAVPLSIWNTFEIFRLVSCKCLLELREANGGRGKREVFPFSRCYVRLPNAAVPYDELLQLQHSALEDGAGMTRLFMMLGDFEREDPLTTCSQGGHAGASSDKHEGGQRPLPPGCRVLLARYAPNHVWLQDVPIYYTPDYKCAGTVPTCPQRNLHGNFAGWGNETCCSPYGGGCAGPSRSNSDPTPHCQCHLGYEGRRCELPCSRGCINRCSGHGQCFAGWCKCEPGWFGLDCSLSSRTPHPAPSAPGRALPPAPPPPKSLDELKIYVYDLPPQVLQGEPCPTGCNDICGGLYFAYGFFLSRLLQDSAHLTTNPEEAHLFYAPQMPYRYTQNGGPPSPHMRDTLAAIRPMGYFDRSNGTDHIWWVVGDIGPCQLNRKFRSGIMLAHYGRLDAWRDGGGRSFGPCLVPAKDMVVPPLTPAGGADQREAGPPGNPRARVLYLQPPMVQQAKQAFAEGWRDVPRPLLLFFAGGSLPMNNAGCEDSANNSDICRNAEYAMGVRAAMFQWYNDHLASMSADVEINNHGLNERYYPKLRSSKFCLDVPGFGFSVRMMDYMASGCIPVIVRDDILWPYESYEYGGDASSNWQQDGPSYVWGNFPRIHYPSFSLSFRKKEIPQIVDRLRAVGPEKLRQLQEGVERVHKAFIWDHDYGLAYNYTLGTLAWIRSNLRWPSQ